MKKKTESSFWNLLKISDLHLPLLFFCLSFTPASFDFFNVQFVLILFAESANDSRIEKFINEAANVKKCRSGSSRFARGSINSQRSWNSTIEPKCCLISFHAI
jgi:hypothetical protein